MVNLMVGSIAEETAFLERVFREADRNKKGMLDKEDMDALLARKRIKDVLGERDSAYMMRCMDRDGDSFVTLDEFLAVLRGIETNLSATGRFASSKQQSATPFLPNQSILHTYRPQRRL